ncbi:SigE family RNA polymerase sigma factor [Nocardioides sp. B-3]|uniref:SigE family RNA polymerase sigma factor n=1 Tax=Nocardioides sp. B-3 TaxID=2895565 RepID=UPI002152C0DB|nr:SigE family RNA polymerase sigma factor [Nocardioides sp. B-3]UUZ61776.1 SigE family RNA polymerase sigma factor [Nocardioides sp. B-3]
MTFHRGVAVAGLHLAAQPTAVHPARDRGVGGRLGAQLGAGVGHVASVRPSGAGAGDLDAILTRAQATRSEGRAVQWSVALTEGDRVGAEPAGFREFVVARSPALLRTAWMLTGDGALAEDLLQTALAGTRPHWKRIADGQPEAYVRTVMVRTSSSWRARRWTGERPSSDALPETGADQRRPDETARVDDRAQLATALGSLPVGQRQAVVLRFFDDLSVEATAQIMGCSTGTVKSQTAKGLVKLRLAMEVTAVPGGERTMNDADLEAMLRELTPDLHEPPDRFARIEKRVRRTRARRIGGAAAVAAVLAVAIPVALLTADGTAVRDPDAVVATDPQSPSQSAAPVDHLPGADPDTPLSEPVITRGTGTTSIDPGSRPEGATGVSTDLRCLSAGTFRWPSGASLTCTARRRPGNGSADVPGQRLGPPTSPDQPRDRGRCRCVLLDQHDVRPDGADGVGVSPPLVRPTACPTTRASPT